MSDVALAVVVQPLTARQREVLDFLRTYIHAHGVAPTITEICAQFELTALSTVWKHLAGLAQKGFIRRRWNKERGIELLTGHRHCPTCTCTEAQT